MYIGQRKGERWPKNMANPEHFFPFKENYGTFTVLLMSPAGLAVKHPNAFQVPNAFVLQYCNR
jgi:hypothetical protein